MGKPYPNSEFIINYHCQHFHLKLLIAPVLMLTILGKFIVHISILKSAINGFDVFVPAVQTGYPEITSTTGFLFNTLRYFGNHVALQSKSNVTRHTSVHKSLNHTCHTKLYTYYIYQ